MKKYSLSYKPFGRSALLIEWPAKIDESILNDIVSFEKVLAWEANIIDTIIAYNSLTVVFNDAYNFKTTVERFSNLYEEKRQTSSKVSKCWQIPVCYDLQFGLDLEEIAETNDLSTDEVIQLHTTPKYLVYFIGFQPGFLYLGGLDKRIHMPRKANPRLRVEKGSVGIGGQQTGIYPQDSSGGWNIIGKTPVELFDITKALPCFAKAGDRIHFESVDLQTFKQIEKEIQKGNYQPKFLEL